MPYGDSFNSDIKRSSAEYYLDTFLSLPRRCQEMFFWYLDTFYKGDPHNPFRSFQIYGFADEDCQSPIESIFSMAYQLLSYTNDFPALDLESQAEIHVGEKRYFADFLFDSEGMFSDFYTSEHNFKLIIECDGHEFHNMTKEQVKRDNDRDFNLKSAGYDVLHFSGSQIYGDPFKCADEAACYIFQHLGKIETGGNIARAEKEKADGNI